MKKIQFLAMTFVMIALVSFALAGVPQTISYQGYLQNTDGTPVTSTTSVRFSLYSSNPARNNPVWRETQSVTPQNGVYSTRLGSVAPLTAPFDVPYHLGLKVEDEAEMPLQPLSSVPYALRVAATTRQGNYNVPAAAFIPVKSSVTYDSTYVGGNNRYLTGPAGTQSLVAAVSLPQGAILENLVCKLNDSSAEYDISVIAYDTVTNNAQCGPYSTSGSSGIQTVTLHCYKNPIDNISMAFLARIINDTACGSACFIQFCTFNYTVSGAP